MDDIGFSTAFKLAQEGAEQGGVPIGSALVLHEDGKEPIVLGAGKNERVQKGSPTLHAEISALENAGRLSADVYRKCTMYTTLSPCSMCSGAILLYGIPRVVIGENKNFRGEEELLRSRGVEIRVLDNVSCEELMGKFIIEKPEEWYEDIGETPTLDVHLSSER
ncbi:cytosine deaminase [Trametopsis cervina]|nr:cytosine deaminase [Trametopsis cervina]